MTVVYPYYHREKGVYLPDPLIPTGFTVDPIDKCGNGGIFYLGENWACTVDGVTTAQSGLAISAISRFGIMRHENVADLAKIVNAEN